MYRGLGPTILGYLPTWAIYFSVYDGIKYHLADPDAEGVPLSVRREREWIFVDFLFQLFAMKLTATIHSESHGVLIFLLR